VTLLLDANLSFRLLKTLAGPSPGSVHVRAIGLARASDQEIWQYAKLGIVNGWPPRIVWIQSHDTSTAAILALFERRAAAIAAFIHAGSDACLIVK
jgi:predicted nuclease of predicted toxin-antitoxin system